ncbi:unnamed protein product [Aureobasidium pullulans]|nr:unnamed protein product [Aureobasidium pullulans]
MRPDEVDRLERRLAQAENRNRSLVAELSRIRSTGPPGNDENDRIDLVQEPEPSDYSVRRSDVAAQVSILSTSAAGERQYLGSTSGVFDRLSDAVLSDAIKLQTAQAQAQQMVQPTLQPAVNNNSFAGDIMTVPRDTTTFSPLAVDTEFLHCFDDLQHLYNTQQIEDPIMELSQDWLGYLGNGNEFAESVYQMPGY